MPSPPTATGGFATPRWEVHQDFSCGFEESVKPLLVRGRVNSKGSELQYTDEMDSGAVFKNWD